MRHLDLFSGIGGFSLALDTIFHETKNTHTFVEYDPFCQAVLKKHCPDAEIHGDIRAFIADAHRPNGNARTDEKEAERRHKSPQSFPTRCDILTGGFPCQPFSHAGRRKGTRDDRYLWPEMLECVALFRPRWVIAENVAGLVSWSKGMVLETICADLEKEGYEVQPFIIPACAVQAPHRRDRLWIIAHAVSEPSTRRGNRNEKIDKKKRRVAIRSVRAQTWSEEWSEVAASLCRVDDGVSRRLDRNPRLKALGNAIVPEVAAQILTIIKEIDERNT